MKYVTNYGDLDGNGLPADLSQEEAERIAKARWDATHDIFDARMKVIVAARPDG